MSNPNRKAYLKEMGIDIWLERKPFVKNPVTECPVTEEVEVKASPVTTVEEKTSSEKVNQVNIASLDWNSLKNQVAECQLCPLSEIRTQALLGTGNQDAALMIVGDAPTAEDEQQGDVFSGQSGKLLTAMLKAMGYQRSDVYLSNIVKCKTVENQEPSEEQASSCEDYLLRQISLVKPQLILALGSTAAQRLLKSKSNMSRLRGQLHYIDDITAPILVSYHPTYLLAAANEKRKAWQDLQLAMKELKL